MPLFPKKREVGKAKHLCLLATLGLYDSCGTREIRQGIYDLLAKLDLYILFYLIFFFYPCPEFLLPFTLSFFLLACPY